MAILFDGDDSAYRAWLDAHPGGYVLNVRRSLVRTYMVLHRAGCWSIGEYSSMARPGGFTERSFRKVCAEELSELRRWVERHGRPDGSFSKVCSLCKPDPR